MDKERWLAIRDLVAHKKRAFHQEEEGPIRVACYECRVSNSLKMSFGQ